jgi:hypothetical protein
MHVQTGAGPERPGSALSNPGTGHGATVTATYGDSGTETVTFSASEVSFLGFADGSGLQSIRISSPLTPSPSIPIVNLGDITYASASQIVVAIPTLSEVALLLLALTLLAAGWRMLAPR